MGKDVNSVAFSGDNRQIVSGSRDKTIKLWNTLAECKYTIVEDMHTDWISCVGFSPSAKMPLIVSAGWDKLVKVWNLSNCKLRTNLVGHTGVVYSTSISPDGSCAHLVARMALPCCGMSTTESTCTRSMLV